MSIEEMENVWKEQSVTPERRAPRSRYWMQRARNVSRTVRYGLFLCLLVTIVGAGLKLHQLVTDPQVTLSNSGVDLLISVLSIIFPCIGIHQVQRHRNELIALAHDPVRCMEALIRETQREIRDLKIVLPMVFVVILGLVGLAKWQSVSTGYESFENAMSGLVLVGVFVTVCGAAMFHRRKAFLEPRLEDLTAARGEFHS